MKLLSTFFIVCLTVFFSFSSLTEGCVLLPSFPPRNVGNIFSMLFGCPFLSESSSLKYDKCSDTWVEECPELDCKYGKEEGDDDSCPFCLLGPGDSCSAWKGNCGDEMICQYSSMFDDSGKCVLKSEFDSRKVGETCGVKIGKCGDDLRCRIISRPFFSCSLEGLGSGICETEEEFRSRDVGEACGGDAGMCREGLTCLRENPFWGQSTCQNVEQEIPEDFCDLMDETQSFDRPSNSDTHGKRHIEIVVKSSNSGNNKAIKKIESDIISSLLTPKKVFGSSFLTEEMGLIKRILNSAQSQGNATTDTTETRVEIINDNSSNETDDMDIFIKNMDSEDNQEICSRETDDDNNNSISTEDSEESNFIKTDFNKIEDEIIPSVVSI